MSRVRRWIIAAAAFASLMPLTLPPPARADGMGMPSTGGDFHRYYYKVYFKSIEDHQWRYWGAFRRQDRAYDITQRGEYGENWNFVIVRCDFNGHGRHVVYRQ